MKKIIFSIALCLLSIFIIAPSASAKVASGGTTTPTANLTGLDISWPQCGVKVPTSQAFGIVGVNGGLATTTNPCLKDQLVWANKSLGGTKQDKIQLYVNTANPGGLSTASWPTNNIDSLGNTTNNTNGICDGSDSLACAWQYGWNRAVEDVVLRFQPAATQAGVSNLASSYIWWLDVETSNTWKSAENTANNQSNVAVLDGMTAYFKSVGGRVGLYSTSYQWNQIVGSSVSVNSNLNGLTSWLAGSTSLTSAKQTCSSKSLTTNGTVVLTQFVSKNLDYNYSCI